MKVSTNVRVVVAIKTTTPGLSGYETQFYFFRSRENLLSPDIKDLKARVSKSLSDLGINPIGMEILSFAPVMGDEIEI
jgi:hypothetical protein